MSNPTPVFFTLAIFINANNTRNEGLMRIVTNPASLPVKRCLAFASLAMLLIPAFSWAYTPENTLLKVKGYSQEVVNSTEHQRTRQEWKTTPLQPQPTAKEKFLHNLYRGDWLESLDDMGGADQEH
jgi:hypothetical protein